MKTYIKQLAGLFLMGMVSCTSLSEGGDTERDPNPEYSRRVQHPGGNNLDRIQRNMDEQSSDINRKRNIEEPPNGPATTPVRLRPERAPNAPVDSTRHNVTWPQRTQVE